MNNDSAVVDVIDSPVHSEPPALTGIPLTKYPTGNPIVIALLSVLVIMGMALRRKS